MAAAWAALRENHSGMETVGKKNGPCGPSELRENHSGMETYTVYVYGVLLFVCCVRTIVVWKLETVSTQTLEVYVA